MAPDNIMFFSNIREKQRLRLFHHSRFDLLINRVVLLNPLVINGFSRQTYWKVLNNAKRKTGSHKNITNLTRWQHLWGDSIPALCSAEDRTRTRRHLTRENIFSGDGRKTNEKMGRRVEWAHAAVDDLYAAAEYIHRDSPSYATAFWDDKNRHPWMYDNYSLNIQNCHQAKSSIKHPENSITYPIISRSVGSGQWGHSLFFHLTIYSFSAYPLSTISIG